jgi:hypothetical protein
VPTKRKRKTKARKESTAVKIPLDFEEAIARLLRVPGAEIGATARDRATRRQSGTKRRA